ncbi:MULTISPECIES: hypothetical protein [Colwellia]|uniref:Uncharacterized protein n=1 Tax=Colwellia marinimaniae TaxID=1513592 RepID=A0ABQ0MWI5_9GAMM|nr:MULTISPECIES: hypothetical protein [Colwellia]GAW96738.1 hypothetical protein MTCD1_02358 [Colwellia marinimaniae]
MSNNISDSAMKGATTVALIGARFGAQSGSYTTVISNVRFKLIAAIGILT